MYVCRETGGELGGPDPLCKVRVPVPRYTMPTECTLYCAAVKTVLVAVDPVDLIFLIGWLAG